MRVTDMHITPIAITDPPLRNAAGLHAPYALRTIVEIVSDNGISGISEIPGSQAVTDALTEAREVVVGHDPFALNHLLNLLEQRFGSRKNRVTVSGIWTP